MHLVLLLTGAIDVDNEVAILVRCMVQAAQQTLKSASALATTLFQGILGLTQNVKLPKK